MGRRGGQRVLRWARPWPLMTSESAGPCGVLAPSIDVARRCLGGLVGLLASFTRRARGPGERVLGEIIHILAEKLNPLYAPKRKTSADSGSALQAELNAISPANWQPNRTFSRYGCQYRPLNPPKRLAHPRSPIPPLSTLTSRATHAHPTSPRSIGLCAIWDFISSSSPAA